MPEKVSTIFSCKRCPCWFYSLSDLESHKKKCLELQTERGRVKWKQGKNGVESVHKSKVPEVVEAIREGHQPIQGFKCWVYQDFVIRRRA